MLGRPTTRSGPDPGPVALPGPPRFEVLPLPGITDAVREFLPPRATVTVTASPRRGQEATVSTAVALALQGRQVVPHLSARLIRDEAALKATLDSLAGSGVTEAFVIGGDAVDPVGEYTSAVDLLPAITRMGHGLRIGIAGYPEPHPLIDDDVVIRAMQDKCPHASYVVSQMCFDASTLLTWVRRMRQRGVDLPVLVGVPGPTSVNTLLRVGARVGVGESTRVLRKHRGLLRRLASPLPWQPTQFLQDLSPGFADPDYGLQGVHVYTFNAVGAAGRWWQEMSHGHQEAAHSLDQ
ncbi:methylenetetrahydrofolate reductase [Janibacter sp. GS2]|uniref:methylenetetrahydrofolate reductase n=1 Tax=Janibacter sp. GS2 TaxID=3442646 RepID=UPI003EB90A15